VGDVMLSRYRINREQIMSTEEGGHFSLSLLGSTAQRKSWPSPQNPNEFLGGFSTIFFFTR
jgi:hypothetical protein